MKNKLLSNLLALLPVVFFSFCLGVNLGKGFNAYTPIWAITLLIILIINLKN